MSHLVAYVDGGSRGNPGLAGIGVVLEHGEGRRVEISESLAAQDNNYAEYAALLLALEYAAACGCARLQVFSDSEVVVRQINGLYTCQSPALRPIYEFCRALIGSFEAFTLTHIRREHNREANRLVQAALRRAPKGPARPLEAEDPAAVPPPDFPWRAALARALQRAALPQS
ncbi:MAG TPA: ribonuclease HI family protein [Terriglobales bacterium]|nr:ribonuclease HI family protein [Terriglobales bacterium]